MVSCCRAGGAYRPPLWVLPLALLIRGAHAVGLDHFLLVSTPRNAQIAYVKLPEDGVFEGLTPQILINKGLHHPQGIAVDHKRMRLFVADPDVQKIYAYQLRISGGTLTTDGRQQIISQQAESRWVAVDGLGNVFFSDEPTNIIYKVPMQKILRAETTPDIVYNGDTLPEVSKPGGVAVDNFHVYWTNKHHGTLAGSVLKASETPIAISAPESVHVMARNVQKSYGICLALGNVFFTEADQYIYGVKKSGGQITEMSSVLKNPRGCVWDGDGTVFVADRGNNGVYYFPGTMSILRAVDVRKAFDFEDAFGLAVVSAASRAWGPLQFFVFMATAASMLRSAIPCPG